MSIRSTLLWLSAKVRTARQLEGWKCAFMYSQQARAISSTWRIHAAYSSGCTLSTVSVSREEYAKQTRSWMASASKSRISIKSCLASAISERNMARKYGTTQARTSLWHGISLSPTLSEKHKGENYKQKKLLCDYIPCVRYLQSDVTQLSVLIKLPERVVEILPGLFGLKHERSVRVALAIRRLRRTFLLLPMFWHHVSLTHADTCTHAHTHVFKSKAIWV